MALVFDGAVALDALSAFTRLVPTPSTHRLVTILPDRMIPDTEVNFDELTRTNRTAKFRAWDARIPYTARDVMTTRSAKMPPLSVRNMLGEQERIRIEQLRTGGTSRAPMVRAVYDDAEQLTREIRNRMELARGAVIAGTAAGTISSVGKLSLNENGLVLEADFGVPSGHKVTAGTAWSTIGSATMIADLAGWVATYIATNGHPPGGFYVSQQGQGYMLQNAELRTLWGSLAGTPARLGLGALRDVLNDQGLPPYLGTIDTVVNVDGTDTRTTPADRLIFVPPNVDDLGFTAWGITATAMELVESSQVDFSFEDAPGIVGVVEKSGPPYRQETFVDAVGMPILANPKKIMVADIF